MSRCQIEFDFERDPLRVLVCSQVPGGRFGVGDGGDGGEDSETLDGGQDDVGQTETSIVQRPRLQDDVSGDGHLVHRHHLSCGRVLDLDRHLKVHRLDVREVSRWRRLKLLFTIRSYLVC